MTDWLTSILIDSLVSIRQQSTFHRAPNNTKSIATFLNSHSLWHFCSSSPSLPHIPKFSFLPYFLNFIYFIFLKTIFFLLFAKHSTFSHTHLLLSWLLCLLFWAIFSSCSFFSLNGPPIEEWFNTTRKSLSTMRLFESSAIMW